MDSGFISTLSRAMLCGFHEPCLSCRDPTLGIHPFWRTALSHCTFPLIYPSLLGKALCLGSGFSGIANGFDLSACLSSPGRFYPCCPRVHEFYCIDWLSFHRNWRGTDSYPPPGDPGFECQLLLLGALLSNLIGTTGASVLLIRPYLRINRGRVKPFHVIFFIFLVSNIGGALTPIGDPPLYLGYLKGVPFFWTLEHLFWPWVCAVSILLMIFFILDSRRGPGEVSPPPGMKGESRAFEVRGGINFLFLLGILACVFLQKFETYFPWPFPQLGMLFFAMLSLYFSPKGVHQDNEFNFHPIREVAILFAAIFITMVPALEYLEGHAQELGLQTPGQFFWATGTLSALLDNAPTYLAFLSSAMGLHQIPLDGGMERFLAVGSPLLMAISCGAVFFGACTYIGNGPNFLVKSIAEKSSVPCPSFLGYLFRFSLPFLIPVFTLIWFLFFSP